MHLLTRKMHANNLRCSQKRMQHQLYNSKTFSIIYSFDVDLSSFFALVCCAGVATTASLAASPLSQNILSLGGTCVVVDGGGGVGIVGMSVDRSVLGNIFSLCFSAASRMEPSGRLLCKDEKLEKVKNISSNLIN